MIVFYIVLQNVMLSFVLKLARSLLKLARSLFNLGRPVRMFARPLMNITRISFKQASSN